MGSRIAVPLCAVALLSSGCLFSKAGPEGRLGDEDAAVDAGNGATADVQMANDLTPSDDIDGRDADDAGDPTSSDTGSDAHLADAADAVDMHEPPAPFEVVARYDATSFASEDYSTDGAADVAMLGDGFMVGFTDPSLTEAVISWFLETEPQSVHTARFDAERQGVDLLGDDSQGYAVFAREQEIVGIHIEPNDEVAEPFFEATEHGSTTNGEYFDSALAREAGTVYSAEHRNYLGPILDLGVIKPDSYGPVTQRDNFELDGIEAIGGGAATGRRILVTGTNENRYLLVEFHWPGIDSSWVYPAFGCGFIPPTVPNGGRILPVAGHWALTLAVAGGGQTVWRLVECEADTAPQNFAKIQVPLTVIDFDVAEEEIVLGSTFGAAWTDGMTVGFGILNPTMTDSPVVTVADHWSIPGASGDHVRVAFNTSTNSYAVAVTDLDTGKVELIILRRADI